MADVRAWFTQPSTGTIETAGAPWWRWLRDHQSETRIVVVRHSPDEVTESLVRVGVPYERDALRLGMQRLDRKLDQIERRMQGVLSVRFDDLRHEATCAAVFQHCLPYPHDPAWWRVIAPIRVQTSMLGTMRYYEAHQAQLHKLALAAKHEIIAGMSRRLDAEIEGVTIQQEPFEVLLRDGVALFAEHAKSIGEPPDSYLQKNIPVAMRLEELGALQITTARSNGRMFGYLMVVIGPSLEHRNVLSAQNTLFYSSPVIPGLSLKLQRASMEALRTRGVGEAFMRVGIRGSGDRMSTVYRRLGAHDFGQMFKLELKEAV